MVTSGVLGFGLAGAGLDFAGAGLAVAGLAAGFFACCAMAGLATIRAAAAIRR